MEKLPYEDLKAFEERLQEVVSSPRPSRFRQRMLFAAVVFVIFMFWYMIPVSMSPWLQAALTFLTIILIVPYVLSHQKPELAPEEIASQTRSVLESFNMSCDNAGRLILKPPRNRAPSTAGKKH